MKAGHEGRLGRYDLFTGAIANNAPFGTPVLTYTTQAIEERYGNANTHRNVAEITLYVHSCGRNFEWQSLYT
jgi:hypothetical protein